MTWSFDDGYREVTGVWPDHLMMVTLTEKIQEYGLIIWYMTWSFDDGYREVKVGCIPTPAPCSAELRGAELDWLSNEADDEEWLLDMELQNLVKVKVMTLDPYAEPVEVNNNNNHNVHLSCAHQRPERSHDTYWSKYDILYTCRA